LTIKTQLLNSLIKNWTKCTTAEPERYTPNIRQRTSSLLYLDKKNKLILHALYIFLHIFISNSNSGEKRTTVLSNYWIINLVFIFRHQHLMAMNQQCLLLLINNNKNNNNPNLDLTQGTFLVFIILLVSNTFIILEQNDAQTNLFLASCYFVFGFFFLFGAISFFSINMTSVYLYSLLFLPTLFYSSSSSCYSKRRKKERLY
jgi:hypothetical protein